MTRLRKTLVATMALAAAGSPTAAAPARASISVVRGADHARAVELRRTEGGQLRGRLKLLVRNRGRGGRLVVRYYPRYRAGRAIPAPGHRVVREGARRSIANGGLAAVDLLITLPARDRPVDLDGWLSIELRRCGRRRAGPLLIDLGGIGDPMKGIGFRPSKVSIQVDDSQGPNHDPTHASAQVELRGPAVPLLFRRGFERARPRLLLRSKNDEVHARLTKPARTKDPEVATATFSVEGPLKPGKYESELPLSDLSDAAPKLEFTVNARDSFVWAALTVLAGALIGGFMYLASARRRRKRLLRMYVKDALRQYRDHYKALGEQTPEVALWDLERYLGDRKKWFRVRWSALPARDGVQGIWSSIAWARSEEDLDGAADQTKALTDRVSRWLDAADAAVWLKKASLLEPTDPPDLDDPTGPPAALWNNTPARRASALLLRTLQTVEPPNDNCARVLLENVDRQTRWHAALARIWHIRSVVMRSLLLEPESLAREQKLRLLQAIDLKPLAERSAVGREVEEQLEDEETLQDYEKLILRLYPYTPGEELEPPGPHDAVVLGAIAPTQAAVRQRPSLVPEERATFLQRLAGGRVNAALWPILVRDFLWSLLTAAVVCAAYLPPFYGPTWGSAGDYATAFAAGFLGKVAINWVSLPAFRSLLPWRKAKQPEEQPPEEPPEEPPPEEKPPESGDAKPPARVPAQTGADAVPAT